MKYLYSMDGHGDGYNKSVTDPDKRVAVRRRLEDMPEEYTGEKMDSITPLEISTICSNLSKACAKQSRYQESDFFNQLAEYYKSDKSPNVLKELTEYLRKAKS